MIRKWIESIVRDVNRKDRDGVLMIGHCARCYGRVVLAAWKSPVCSNCGVEHEVALTPKERRRKEPGR